MKVINEMNKIKIVVSKKYPFAKRRGIFFSERGILVVLTSVYLCNLITSTPNQIGILL
jgi:hypothetical protein